MKFLIALIAAIAVVSADRELDAMEKAAYDVLARIHTHMGGQGENSLYNSLTNGDFLRESALQLQKTKSDKLEEGVGSLGVTFVSVTRGNKQVNVTTVYGVGAGAVVNIRDERRTAIDGEVEEPSVEELNEITEPLLEKYVNQFIEEDAKNATVVHLGDEGLRSLNLKNQRETLRARARGGFRVGARTTVTKSG